MPRARNSSRPRPHRSRLRIGLRILVIAALVLVVGGFGLFSWLRASVHRQTRSKIESEMNIALNPLGLHADIGGAVFVEGVGFQLSDVNIVSQPENQSAAETSDDPILSIYQAFISVPEDLTALIAKKIDQTEIPPKAIEIRRARFTIARNANGEWNIASLLDRMSDLKLGGNAQFGQIPITLSDSTIRIVDRTVTPPRERLLRDIDIRLTHIQHLGRRLAQIQTQFSARHVSKVQLTTFIDPERKTWRTALIANQARLTQDLVDAIPADLQQMAGMTQRLSGFIDLNGSAEGSFPLEQIPKFSITGKLSDLTFAHENLPLPINGASCQFTVSDDRVEINNAQGYVGTGSFQFDFSQNGLIHRKEWAWKGSLKKIKFDHRLGIWFPKQFKTFCTDFSPDGTADLDFNLRHDGQQLTRTMDGRLQDMSFRFIRFPFQLNHCTGGIQWIDDRFQFKVNTTEAEQPVVISGLVRNPGPDAMFRIDVDVDGFLPIDKKMLRAADAKPKLAKVARAFNAQGGVKIAASFERRAPNAEIEQALDFEFKQCSIRHDHFDYPMYNVNGKAAARNGRIEFTNITGENNSALATCNGSWTERDGLNLRFIANSVPLDDQLKFSLKKEMQELWTDFRPQGTLGLVVTDLALASGERTCRLKITTNLTARNQRDQEGMVSIQPVWFPYLVTGLTGMVEIGDGQITLKDIKGKHNRTWITGQGAGQYSSSDWSVTLSKLLIGALRIDEDLLKSIPSPLRPTLQGLKYQGIVNVDGAITLAGQHEPVADTNLVHHAGGFEPIRPSAEISNLPIQSSHSTQPLQGTRPGDSAAGSTYQAVPVVGGGPTGIAQASFDTAYRNPSTQPGSTPFATTTTLSPQSKNRQSIIARTSLKAPSSSTRMSWELGFHMNNAKIMLGLPVENVYGSVQLRGNFDGQELKCRGELSVDSLSVYDAHVTDIKGPLWFDNDHAAAGTLTKPDQFQKISPESVTGTMNGGLVQLDAQVMSGTAGDFFVQASLADGSLKEITSDFAPQTEQIEGRTFAGIRLTGDTASTNSLRGVGAIQLRDARMYELPVMLSLLKLLRRPFVDRTAFDSGDFNFTIDGRNLNFHRIELIGDAISLIGNGQMNLDWDIDLNFYSVMGRNRFEIPVLSRLHRASSQKILWVNVDGTLDDPKLESEVLPELNESLRQLFKQPTADTGLFGNLQSNRPRYLLQPNNAGPATQANQVPGGNKNWQFPNNTAPSPTGSR